MKALNAKPTEALFKMIENDLTKSVMNEEMCFHPTHKAKPILKYLQLHEVKEIKRAIKFRTELMQMAMRYSNAELAKMFGVTKSCIENIAKGRSHKDV